MNKVTRVGVVAAAVVVAAGGSYAAYAATANSPDETVSASRPSATPSADVSAESSDSTPVPTETAWPYTAVPNGEATFLHAMHADGFLNGITIPSDHDLLADAQAACDQLANGIAYDHTTVIEDDPTPPSSTFGRGSATNSANLAGIASQTLCIEYSIADIPVIPPVNPR